MPNFNRVYRPANLLDTDISGINPPSFIMACQDKRDNRVETFISSVDGFVKAIYRFLRKFTTMYTQQSQRYTTKDKSQKFPYMKCNTKITYAIVSQY